MDLRYAWPKSHSVCPSSLLKIDTNPWHLSFTSISVWGQGRPLGLHRQGPGIKNYQPVGFYYLMPQNYRLCSLTHALTRTVLICMVLICLAPICIAEVVQLETMCTVSRATHQDYTLANLDCTPSHGMNYMGRKPHKETYVNHKKHLSQTETPAAQNLILPVRSLLSSLSSLCGVFNKPFSRSGLKSNFIHQLVNTQFTVLLSASWENNAAGVSGMAVIQMPVFSIALQMRTSDCCKIFSFFFFSRV